MKRHDKEKKERLENVPEIFKVLWELSFVEEISMTRVKNEVWPKIHIVISCEDENKVKMIRALVQKYEFPFSNLKIVPDGSKKGQGSCKEDPASAKKPDPVKKTKFMFKVSGSNRPPFKAV